MSPVPERSLEPRTFRFPARDGADGPFSALVHKDNANGALARMEEAWTEQHNALGKKHRDLRSLLRRLFDGKGIEYDGNGWAEVTMHEDEVHAIQEAIRVQ